MVQTLHRNDRVVEIVQIVEQDAELIATHARKGVTRSHVFNQPLSKLDKQLISGQVSQGVVNAFEAVEVEEENGKRTAISALPPRHSFAQVIHVECAIGQAGKPIVQSFMQQALFDALTV